MFSLRHLALLGAYDIKIPGFPSVKLLQKPSDRWNIKIAAKIIVNFFTIRFVFNILMCRPNVF